MNKIAKKQQLRLFLGQLISFGLVFLALGIILLSVYEKSVFQSVDQELNAQVTRFKSRARQSQQADDPKKELTDLPPNFRTTMLFWSKEGAITNQDMLGNRYTSLKSLTLKTSDLNEKSTIQLSDGTTFRSITVKGNTNQTGNVGLSAMDSPQYIQFLVNIDAEKIAVTQFRMVLIISLIVFWLLSIALSYWLSRLNMKPIMKSWHRQQQFVENASHELRTPLAIIQSKLEYLLTKPHEQIINESEPIALSLSETRRLTSLTNDLLMLARSDANMLTIKREEVLIDQFMNDVLEPYREVAKQQNKQLVFKDCLNAKIVIDPKLIHQLLVILVDNAIKYTQETDTITVHSYLKQQNWELSVANNGPSISNAHKKQIFERFYREDDSRNKQTGGTGLGLSIAKWIVESHGGKIMVEDYHPHGVQFIIQIPLTKS